jgi:enoyl-CoA hydratase
MAALWTVETQGKTAIVRYANPPANLFAPAAIDELAEVLESIAGNEVIRAVVIASGISDVFGAGLDLRRIPRSGATLERVVVRAREVNRRIDTFPKPVLVAIEGACYGGALELALACHVRLVSASARLALPEIAFGIVPAGGATQRLPRLIGRAQAMRYLLSGLPMTGEEALRIRLVDVLTPRDQALPEAIRLARRMARMDPRLTKTIIELLGCTEGALAEGLVREESAVLMALTARATDGRCDDYVN